MVVGKAGPPPTAKDDKPSGRRHAWVINEGCGAGSYGEINRMVAGVGVGRDILVGI